jgi:hypothetical protein
MCWAAVPGTTSPPKTWAETVTITEARFDSSTGELLLFAKDPNYGGSLS